MVKETFARNKPSITQQAAPATNFVDVTITTASGVLTVFDVEFDNQPDSAFYAMVYVTTPMGTGIMRPKKSAFRLLASQQIPTTPFTLDLSTEYQARFGDPELAAKIFTKVILLDSDSGALHERGQLGVRVEGS